MALKQIIVFIIAATVFCGCGRNEEWIEMPGKEKVPSTTVYARQAQRYLAELKLRGGLDEDLPVAVSRMTDGFQTASDEEKMRLYKAVGGTPEVEIYKIKASELNLR